MAGPSPIEWTDATWNPIGGCSIKSPGCINCYAQKLAGTRLARLPLYAGTTDLVKGKPVFNGRLTAAPDDADVWSWPLRWRGAKAARDPEVPRIEARPSRIFVGDMSDLFHADRPLAVIDRVFAVMALTHTPRRSLATPPIFQLLTKRADVLQRYISDPATAERVWTLASSLSFSNSHLLLAAKAFCGAKWGGEAPWPLPNVHLGVSAERQQEADERIPLLLATPAAVRFVSLEPLLGPIDLTAIPIGRQSGDIVWTQDALRGPPDLQPGERLDWVIVGGESGPNARPMHPDWARSLLDQCTAADVRFFFKQWGEWEPWTKHPMLHDRALSPSGAVTHDWPDGTHSIRVGKRAAGRRLDGVEWNEFPGATPC